VPPILIASMAWINKRKSSMKEWRKSTTTEATTIKNIRRAATATQTKMPLPSIRLAIGRAVGKGKQANGAPLSLECYLICRVFAKMQYFQ